MNFTSWQEFSDDLNSYVLLTGPRIPQCISMCVIGGWLQAGLEVADTQEDIDRIKLLLDEAITESLITEEKVD